ncbi:hypothetical protein Tco_0634818 [Tanacetum coccineum]
MLQIKVYEIGEQHEIFTSEAWKRLFDINKRIYPELCHEFCSTYAFDEVCVDDELRTKKEIKFRFGDSGHTLTLLEFARRLGLYHDDEVNDEGFEVYFQGGLRSGENFNARDYWLSISSEEELHLSRSLALTIRRPILRVLPKMITYGVCQRTTGYDKMQRNKLLLMSRIIKRMELMTDEVLNSLSAPTYYRARDSTTLRELIGLNGRMGNMDIHQGTLERMTRRQLYHIDRYAGLFEHMVGHFGYTLRGAYAPPVYDTEQHED